ncbi:unnamed protein product [Calypogeia fissa]
MSVTGLFCFFPDRCMPYVALVLQVNVVVRPAQAYLYTFGYIPVYEYRMLAYGITPDFFGKRTIRRAYRTRAGKLAGLGWAGTEKRPALGRTRSQHRECVPAADFLAS